MENNDTMILRKAEMNELDALYDFFDEIIAAQDDAPESAKWTKDVYPTRQDLQTAIEEGEMIVGMVGDRIACAQVISGNDEIYNDVVWPTEADPSEVSVLHLLCVHPDFYGRGYARQLIRYAIDYNRKLGRKVIRLDVIKGNGRAEKLYTSEGFVFVEERKIYYADTGLDYYRLLEYVL